MYFYDCLSLFLYLFSLFFFFKQKTAYEMRISDWSSDVCSSDLPFYFALLGSIAAATSARGFNLLVSFQESAANFRADFVASGLADAMIVIGTTSNRTAWDFFAEAQAAGLGFTCWGSPGHPFHWMRSDNAIGEIGRSACRERV